MAGYDGRGARFPLTIVRGADLSFQLTATTAGSPVNLSAATIAGEIYNAAGTVVDTLIPTISGAGSNVVTLAFTDTETAALTATRYSWTLWVTRSGDKRPWLAGQVNVTDGTQGQSGSTGAYTLTVDEDVSIAVDVNGGGGGGGSSVTIQATAPVSPSVGDLWVDSDDLALYAYYNDGDSSQWVAIGGPAGPAGPSGSGSGDLLSTNNLSDVASAATARTNLGLGNAATLTVDADLATLSLPASTTISAFGATLVDDADAATARTTIGAVGLTGNETVAGVKTFSSDPIIPDEVYGVGWNGSLEPPTKNAVYDKIETLGGGGAIRVEDEGTSTVAAATALNFVGAGVTVTDAGSNEAIVTISGGGSGIRVEDEGTSVVAVATGINFAGAGVTVTDAGSNEALVTISGGGGSSDPLDAEFIISGRIFSR